MRGRWIYITFLVYGVISVSTSAVVDSTLLLGILIAVLIILAAVIYYFDWHKPTQASIENRIEASSPFFCKLIIQHLRAEFGISSRIRCNIMIVRRKFIWWGYRSLKIDYCTDHYQDTELEQEYGYNVGCCGTALAEAQQIYFDSIQAQEPYKGMSQTQRLATERIKSILSTPIFSVNDISLKSPKAILNLDSFRPIKNTKFDNEEVMNSLRKFSGLMSRWFL